MQKPSDSTENSTNEAGFEDINNNKNIIVNLWNLKTKNPSADQELLDKIWTIIAKVFSHSIS